MWNKLINKYEWFACNNETLQLQMVSNQIDNWGWTIEPYGLSACRNETLQVQQVRKLIGDNRFSISHMEIFM